MNEKAVFFYFPVCFNFPLQNLNEWMTFELFHGKEKKTQKNPGKKTQTTFTKKIGIRQKSEWMTDELFLGKKTSLCFFPAFSASRLKKKTNGFEWMNDQRPCP